MNASMKPLTRAQRILLFLATVIPGKPGFIQNGNKVSISVLAAAAVVIAVSVVDLSRGGTSIAGMAVTGFFGFLGGLLMGKQL